MKKLLVLVGILAAFSLMGCPKDPKDPVNPPASDPIENENTGGDSAEDDTPTEIVLFDPSTYTGDVGVIEELDGEKYVKVVVDGYKSIIPADIKGSNIKSIKGNVKVEKGADETATQWAVQFVDADMKQAAAFSGQDFDTVKEYTSKWGEDFSYTDWNNGGATVKGVADCTGIQVYVQHPANNYEALKGCIMYIGKIIAE